MTKRSYDELCKQINYEYNKIKEPSRDDFSNLSKKLNIDRMKIRINLDSNNIKIKSKF